MNITTLLRKWSARADAYEQEWRTATNTRDRLAAADITAEVRACMRELQEEYEKHIQATKP